MQIPDKHSQSKRVLVTENIVPWAKEGLIPTPAAAPCEQGVTCLHPSMWVIKWEMVDEANVGTGDTGPLMGQVGVWGWSTAFCL